MAQFLGVPSKIREAKASNKDISKPYEPNLPDDFPELCQEVCHYIADIVWRRLGGRPKNTHHLAPIASACRTGGIVSISTLCHDTHIESYLAKAGISLADGFSDPQEGYRYWKDEFSSEHTTPFLKLHGSVNWFRIDTEICIPPEGRYQERLRREDGTFEDAFTDRPELLIGTFNKLSEYSQGIFLELHYRFRATLKEADKLVVCGYSFGDKGINTEIIEWYFSKPGRSFVIIHPDPEDLFKNARGAIRKYWEKDPIEQTAPFREHAHVIEKRLEDVTSEELLVSL